MWYNKTRKCKIFFYPLERGFIHEKIYKIIYSCRYSGSVSQSRLFNALEKELKHLDNGGRNEFFEQMKKKYGVNNDPRANAMLDRIMTRLSASIAKTDPSITKKPYNYFVNDDKSFNAFCTIL